MSFTIKFLIEELCFIRNVLHYSHFAAQSLLTSIFISFSLQKLLLVKCPKSITPK